MPALYHRLSDTDSAAARREIFEDGLKDRVDYRNVDISESAKADLLKLTGADRVPALDADGQVYVGIDAIRDWIVAQRESARATD